MTSLWASNSFPESSLLEPRRRKRSSTIGLNAGIAINFEDMFRAIKVQLNHRVQCLVYRKAVEEFHSQLAHHRVV